MSRAGEFNQHLARAARRVSDFHPHPSGWFPCTGWLPAAQAHCTPLSAVPLTPPPLAASIRLRTLLVAAAHARTLERRRPAPRSEQVIAFRHTNFDPRTRLILFINHT